MKTLSLYFLFSGLLFSVALVSTNSVAEDCTPTWCNTPKSKLTPTEQAICQSPELQIADQLLNQTYQNYRKILSGKAQKKLIDAQVQWRVEERDKLNDKHELLASILERIMALNFMSSVVDNP